MSDIDDAPKTGNLRRYVEQLAASAGFPVRPWPHDKPRPHSPQARTPPFSELIPSDDDIGRLAAVAGSAAGLVGNVAMLDRGNAGDAIPALDRAAEQLHRGNTSYRFPRLHLVQFLAKLEVERPENADAIVGLMHKLREYRAPRGVGEVPGPDVVKGFQSWNLRTIAITILASGLPAVLFRMWYYGTPGLGREFRWLRKQRREQETSEDFGAFLLGLTRPPGTAGGDETRPLAARAFLADLRAACEPRRGRGAHGWRRARPPVLVLDQTDGNLLSLFAAAREKSEPDPLLVLVVSSRQGARSPLCEPVQVMGDQYEDHVPPLPDPPPVPPRWRRWRRLVAVTVAALVCALIVAAWHPWDPTVSTVPPVAGPCAALMKQKAETSIVAWVNKSGPGDSECVGYSTTVPFPAGKESDSPDQQLQDDRLIDDQRQVFAMDQQADVARANGRLVLSLVYFAGLTSAPNDDYDSGEAEELEGLLAAQQLAKEETNGPMLKIVVADGGSKMKDAVAVTNMLLPLFAHDRSLLGVVGLDRSVTQVKQAIGLFRRNGIPIVASTLSADGIGAGDPSYFQMSPDNTEEARLILSYIQNGVPEYFGQRRSIYYSNSQVKPSQISVYYPSHDPDDLYINTLVADLERVRRTDPQFRNLAPVQSVTDPNNLCGADRVVVYAGRHDLSPPDPFNTFATFLRAIAADCQDPHTRPFIIADDGVSRFIADPADRNLPGLKQMSISYVTKAVAVMQTGSGCLTPAAAQATARNATQALSNFCQQYATIVARLRKDLKEPVPFQWTGDRVGVAYDAAQLFIQAATRGSTDNSLISRSQIPATFESGSYPGVVGTVTFTGEENGKPAVHAGADSAGGMPLAVIRIAVSPRSNPDTPTCEYTMTSGKILGFGPGQAPGPHLPCPALSQ